MREDRAIERVEEAFGGVEDFAWVLLTEFPDAVKGDYNLQTLSGRLELPESVVSRVLSSSAFRTVVSRLIVSREYTMLDEIKHVRTMKQDATSGKKNTSTRVAAREHLARLEGRPLSRQEESVNVPIQINFGSLPGSVEGVPTVTVEGSGHRMAGPGELPPEGARRKYTEKSSGETLVRGIPRGDELDFYSDESPYPRAGAGLLETQKKDDGESK